MTPQSQNQGETRQREQAHDEDERLEDLDPSGDEAATVQGGDTKKTPPPDRTLDAIL